MRFLNFFPRSFSATLKDNLTTLYYLAILSSLLVSYLLFQGNAGEVAVVVNRGDQDQDGNLPSDLLDKLTSKEVKVFAAGHVSGQMTLFISGSSSKTDFAGGYQVSVKDDPADGRFSVDSALKLVPKYNAITGTEVMFVCQDADGSSSLITMTKDSFGALNLGLNKFTKLNINHDMFQACFAERKLHLSTTEAKTYYLVDQSSGSVAKYAFVGDSISSAQGCSVVPTKNLGNLCKIGEDKITLSKSCSGSPPANIISGFVSSGTAYLFDGDNTVYYFDATIFSGSGSQVDLKKADSSFAWYLQSSDDVTTSNSTFPHHHWGYDFNWWMIGTLLIAILFCLAFNGVVLWFYWTPIKRNFLKVWNRWCPGDTASEKQPHSKMDGDHDHGDDHHSKKSKSAQSDRGSRSPKSRSTSVKTGGGGGTSSQGGGGRRRSSRRKSKHSKVSQKTGKGAVPTSSSKGVPAPAPSVSPAPAAAAAAAEGQPSTSLQKKKKKKSKRKKSGKKTVPGKNVVGRRITTGKKASAAAAGNKQLKGRRPGQQKKKKKDSKQKKTKKRTTSGGHGRSRSRQTRSASRTRQPGPPPQALPEGGTTVVAGMRGIGGAGIAAEERGKEEPAKFEAAKFEPAKAAPPAPAAAAPPAPIQKSPPVARVPTAQPRHHSPPPKEAPFEGGGKEPADPFTNDMAEPAKAAHFPEKTALMGGNPDGKANTVGDDGPAGKEGKEETKKLTDFQLYLMGKLKDKFKSRYSKSQL